MAMSYSVLSLGLMLLGAGVAAGQSYPGKPLRIITGGVGGGNDVSARLVAQGLSVSMGQQTIVDNRSSGAVTAEAVAKAAPDGYTILVYGSTIWITPLMQKTPCDAVADFAAITTIANSPHVVVVHPSLPVKFVSELIALAKARPGELNYGSAGTGTSNHLAPELFISMANVRIVHVPYKSASTQIADLLGGQVQLMFSATGAALPLVKSGRLKALAVTSARPSALAPGLPTVAASGLPGFESGALYVMFAPARTPQAVIARLNQDTVRLLNQTDVKEKFFSAGMDAAGSTPDVLAARMKSEIARLGKLIRDAGIRVE